VKKVLPHQAGADRIATGYRLSFGLGPALVQFGFLCRHEPRATQSGQIGRMTFAARHNKGLDRRDSGIVGNDRAQSIEKDPLAVRATAVKEEDRLPTATLVICASG
jgi:hypothetical protein